MKYFAADDNNHPTRESEIIRCVRNLDCLWKGFCASKRLNLLSLFLSMLFSSSLLFSLLPFPSQCVQMAIISPAQPINVDNYSLTYINYFSYSRAVAGNEIYVNHFYVA